MLSWLTQSYFGKIVATFIISMLPVVELRGGIPYGVGFGLEPWEAYIAAILGNFLPVPFILLFIEAVFGWMKKRGGWMERLVLKLEAKADSKKESVTRFKALGLMIFVAIPLPGTGAWTGALVARALGIKFKYAAPSIFAGVVIAGIIVTVISYGIKIII